MGSAGAVTNDPPTVGEHMHAMAKQVKQGLAVICLALATITLSSARAVAHCDGLDGPVVAAARTALERRDVRHALIWVQAADEAAIRSAFERTLAVRRLSPLARELADTYFFETLVRIHRAGEGAPYTGLKPAGRDLGPAIPAADRALATGDSEPLLRLLCDAAERGVRERFAEARAAQAHPTSDVRAGREYVEKYVTFIHHVEQLYAASASAATSHAEAAESAGHH